MSTLASPSPFAGVRPTLVHRPALPLRASTGFVLAHDYLTQRGGAERVALALAQGLDARRIITSVYDPGATFDGFRHFEVVTSGLPLLDHFRKDVRRALPLLSTVWSHMRPVRADVLVCSSSGWAHAMPAAPQTTKIVYCHNPARWLYQPEDYLLQAGLVTRTALKTLSPGLKRWDRRAAATADAYVANSTAVARRIAQTYGIQAEVIHPPVALDVQARQEAVEAVEPGFFLMIARARGYKMADALIAAFAGMPEHRLVVVGGAMPDGLPSNITALGRVSEARLRWLYAHARALVSTSHEDFGLTPIEANAFGTPALVLRAGGFLDSTAEGVSGSFIEDGSVDAVRAAVQGFRGDWDPDAIRRHAAQFSPASFVQKLTDLAERTRLQKLSRSVLQAAA